MTAETARDRLRAFALAAFKDSPNPLVESHVDELIAARDAEVLREAAATIRHHHGGNHPYADLLDTVAEGSAT
jgi:hypothetical protein